MRKHSDLQELYYLTNGMKFNLMGAIGQVEMIRRKFPKVNKDEFGHYATENIRAMIKVIDDYYEQEKAKLLEQRKQQIGDKVT